MTKVLIITYYWPPSSGAGVQRWLKFSKYLPSFGWEPLILTIDPDFAAYPAIDETLEKDISKNTKVIRTAATDYFRFYRKDKTKVPSAGFATSDDSGIKSKILRFIRGNFFIPDPRRGWNRCAYRRACEIIVREKIKYIITTSPPHSTQLIGIRLKNKFPFLKWIADLRDPWTDIYYYSLFYHTFPARLIDRKLEKQVLRSADKIITVGSTLKDLFASKVAGIDNKITVITNGFDEDDFKDIFPYNQEKLTITYTGTLSDVYPLDGFLNAVENIIKKGREVRLRFVGSVSPRQKDLIIARAGLPSTEFIHHVDHISAIRYMHESSALLLIIPDHPSGNSILTGKLFEYIACRIPVICLGPADGDAAKIIRETSAGRIYDYNDSEGIEQMLLQTGNDGNIPDSAVINKYTRKALTEALVRLLND